MNVYEIVTDRILASLERGVAPWNRPWGGAANQPRSLNTGREYRGINVFVLNAMGYSSPYWLTLNQANKLGARIRKGERGTPVVFWKFGTREVQDGECERTVLARYYTVFNVEQAEGLDVPADLLKPAAPISPLAECEALLSKYLDKPEVKYVQQRAWYHKGFDTVNMPKPESFTTREDYYSTLFHEFVHSTGHLKRLNRPTLMDAAGFGDRNYSKEELVAEMGAAYLCGHAGIENQTIEQSASYLDGWLRALRNDRKLLISAASQAQKAADYMLGTAARQDSETEPSVVPMAA
jgi:antirestriction protein ArdC